MLFGNLATYLIGCIPVNCHDLERGARFDPLIFCSTSWVLENSHRKSLAHRDLGEPQCPDQ